MNTEPRTRNLVRTNRGTFIHRAECFMAQRGRAKPWAWADQVPQNELEAAVVHFGYRMCRRCSPIPSLVFYRMVAN